MGTAAFYHKKQPDEEYDITIDFATNRLESAETIDTVAVTATDPDGTDVSASLLGADTESNGVVTIPVKNGTDGKRYDIKTLVTADSGNKYEQDVVLEIIDG